VGAGVGEPLAAEEGGEPLLQSPTFGPTEELAEAVAEGSPEGRGGGGQVLPLLGFQLATAPVPEDGAELWFHVKADPMVDPQDPPVGQGEEVTDLPIGVVDHCVKEGDPAEALIASLYQGEAIHGRVGGDPQLNGPRSKRTVAEDGGGNDPPAGEGGELVGGNLPVGEGAGGKVPQGPLAADRLVDAGGLEAR
jgi:hypothetical protein